MLKNCIFCKIVKNELLSQKVYEDESVFAFKDINPQAPVHVIIIPKKHITSLSVISVENEKVLGHIQVTVSRIAKQFSELKNGFRLINNCGVEGGQTVLHLHYHLLGGRSFRWPPG
ncbi:MAG: histidine triad nucleotide-binding protein [Endomicrobium sp.]|jgi:histidine triad (HIT) family protein|nr:histidine triad nucleotide-binding protein [Endomicrobium sp.]